MKGLGKLVGMLNPLDQSAVNQIRKSAGGGFLNQAVALSKAGINQVKSGAYFRGQHLVYDAKAVGGKVRGYANRSMGTLGSGTSVRARTAVARGTGEWRRNIAMGGAAWAGLNLMAPDSNLTKAANWAGGIGAVYGAGRMSGSSFGPMARNLTWGAGGAYGAGKLFGVI